MFFSFRERPVSDAYLEALAIELVECAQNNESALVFTEFLEAKMLNKSTWMGWLKRDEALRQAYAYALMCLGNHREIGGLTGKLDAGLVAKSQAMYSDDWKRMEEWKAKLKEELGGGNGTIRVVMEPVTLKAPVKEISNEESRANTVLNDDEESLQRETD